MISEENLCDKNGISVDDITKEICDNELDVCEAYIKKGSGNAPY